MPDEAPITIEEQKEKRLKNKCPLSMPCPHKKWDQCGYEFGVDKCIMLHCDTCKKPSSELKSPMWGTDNGVRCNSCMDKVLAKLVDNYEPEEGAHDDTDYPICPHCGTEDKQMSHIINASNNELELHCSECENNYFSEATVLVSFKTRKV